MPVPVSLSSQKRTGLTTNLGLLGYFKYGGFLLDNFLLLMRALGLEVSLASPSIILPAGISFYTFQTLSYTLDVYRRNLRPPDSFLDYALYVTFFPQLVAGPIVRATDFLPQCNETKAFSGKAVGWGWSRAAVFLLRSHQAAEDARSVCLLLCQRPLIARDHLTRLFR